MAGSNSGIAGGSMAANGLQSGPYCGRMKLKRSEKPNPAHA
jgi:hypothetical protein